jgi:spore coat protein U-like protein
MGSQTPNILLRKAAAAALGLLAVATAPAAQAQSDDGIAKVAVVSRLSFINVEELEFGTLLSGPTAGSVTVSPTGVRTATGGVTLVGGLVQPARFAGQGRFNQIVLISLVTSPTTLTRVGGTETMRLDTLTIGSTPTAVLTTSPMSFRIGRDTGIPPGGGRPTGIFNFPIGGTLRVNANQVPGDYVGTFSVTLNYQ